MDAAGCSSGLFSTNAELSALGRCPFVTHWSGVSPAPAEYPPHGDRGCFPLGGYKAVRNGPKLCSAAEILSEFKGWKEAAESPSHPISAPRCNLEHNVEEVNAWSAVWNCRRISKPEVVNVWHNYAFVSGVGSKEHQLSLLVLLADIGLNKTQKRQSPQSSMKAASGRIKKVKHSMTRFKKQWKELPAPIWLMHFTLPSPSLSSVLNAHSVSRRLRI